MYGGRAAQNDRGERSSPAADRSCLPLLAAQYLASAHAKVPARFFGTYEYGLLDSSSVKSLREGIMAGLVNRVKANALRLGLLQVPPFHPTSRLPSPSPPPRPPSLLSSLVLACFVSVGHEDVLIRGDQRLITPRSADS